MKEQIEKQAIEEMANEICSVCHAYKNCVNTTPCTMAYKEAEELYQGKRYHKQEWVSVDDRLPSKSGKYICCTTKGTILIERFYQLDDGGWFSNHKFCTVTHWMPLPETPNMKGGAE